MTQDQITIINNVRACLEKLTVSGRQNCTIVAACCNDLDSIIATAKPEKVFKSNTGKED